MGGLGGGAAPAPPRYKTGRHGGSPLTAAATVNHVHYKIAQIGGDGIGPEVLGEAVRLLEASQRDGLRFSFEEAEVGAALYRRTGEDLPRETVDLCRAVDAILFGAAGLPDIRTPTAPSSRPRSRSASSSISTRACDR